MNGTSFLFLTDSQTSNWGFGTSELISLVSAVATLAAVIVSLYLANKSRTIKPKLKINNKMAGISIYNAGDAKFLISAFGAIIDKTIYIDNQARFCKLLSSARQIDAHRSTHFEFSFNQVLLEPGDIVEVGLEYFDSNLFVKNKTYLFVAIGNKIKKVKLDTDKVENKNDSERMNYTKADKKDINNIGFYLHS